MVTGVLFQFSGPMLLAPPFLFIKLIFDSLQSQPTVA